MGAAASLGRSVFGRGLNEAVTGGAQASAALASADSRLPDGTAYAAWEQPLTFSKTYYVDNGDAKADDNGPGTQARPFRTINKAAQVLQPGERVVIAAGIYRECVRPARGGTSPAQMISYEAAPGAQGVHQGLRSAEGRLGAGAHSGRRLGLEARADRRSRRSPRGATNSPARCSPMPTSRLPCPASWAAGRGSIPGSVDMGPFLRRRGLVFVDGKPLEPVEQQRELAAPGLQPVPDFTVPAQPQNGLPPRRAGRADHAGGRRLARCALLGRGVGAGDSASVWRRARRRTT